MAASTQLSLPEQAHRNHGLFSDYYLNNTLLSRADWRLLASEALPVMKEARRLLDAYAPTQIEAQTERDIVRPVLGLLGHTFEVQVPLHTPSGTKRPDYVFYRDAEARAALRNRVLTEEELRPVARAVGDAKYWDRRLDVAVKGKGGDPFSNANPSYQIAYYMQHSGVEWGILTNGRLWRLYHRESAHKLDRYYEVDLPELVHSGDVNRFLYFYAFFRHAAFDAHEPLSLASMLRESAEYARGVGETLKAQVYDALRHLAQGFLDYRPNGLTADPTTLREIYDSSLIVLYRLLFVLYAEARDLLPVNESEEYRVSYSLRAIKEEVAVKLDVGRRLLPNTATLWPRLQTLFGIINEGSPPLRVATFNGGLFDPERHRFLERHTVGDAHLQQALDMLARVGPAGRREYVDYRDLAERHLGTIYEGLLEYHLQATEPDKDGWTVTLLNDRGERKATGSYYTPDFIGAPCHAA